MVSGDILYPHQKAAVSKMHNGCILCGGVGSGKSITSLYYYALRESNRPLYIITTARKRDTAEWFAEFKHFPGMSAEAVDSWNNIDKYADVKGAFFIFDEQRVVGKGKWSKTFIKIAQSNHWVLLSATPGDNWMDYIPVMIANGFYRNRTDFINHHVIFNPYVKFQQVQRYVDCDRLMKYKNAILVDMEMDRHTVRHKRYISCGYDREKYRKILKDRWDIYENAPIENISRLCSLLRRVGSESSDRQIALLGLLNEHPKAVIFYNFDYELEILKELLSDYPVAEWNGHKHEKLPEGEKWAYLVQYTAGAEGWNCITTDTVIFYSLNYSYKTTEQAMGRIDRLNTPYHDLYYFFLYSPSSIEHSIRAALNKKKDFNEKMIKW